MTTSSFILNKELSKKTQVNNNVFAYNPREVIKPSEHQTGEEPLKKISKDRPLLPGKRISASGKTYYEYRKNRSSLQGRVK